MLHQPPIPSLMPRTFDGYSLRRVHNLEYLKEKKNKTIKLKLKKKSFKEFIEKMSLNISVQNKC